CEARRHLASGEEHLDSPRWVLASGENRLDSPRRSLANGLGSIKCSLCCFRPKTDRIPELNPLSKIFRPFVLVRTYRRRRQCGKANHSDDGACRFNRCVWCRGALESK